MDSLKQKFLLVAKEHSDVVDLQLKLAKGFENGVFDSFCDVRKATPLCTIALAKTQAVERVLKTWATRGLVLKSKHGFKAYETINYQKLALWFEGLSAHSEVFPSPPQIDLVATISEDAHYLLKMLERYSVYKPEYHDTEGLFKSLATRSTTEFVVMSPFIDSHSESYLLELFDSCPEGISKSIFLRSKDIQSNRLKPFLLKLVERGVLVYDYVMDHTQISSQLQFETFHAKVLMADREYTYLGSANMTRASRKISMELGVYVRCQELGAQLGKILDCVKDIPDASLGVCESE